MVKVIVTGCGTEVGKTLTCAILTQALNSDYWKPVGCGKEKDPDFVQAHTQATVFPSAYSLAHPLSPHHAARLENIEIDPETIVPPTTKRPLLIETAGGLHVPLNHSTCMIDLLSQWKATWIVVSRHYLGSINHTLLTIEALKYRSLPIHSIIFNGAENRDTEQAILSHSGLKVYLRLPTLSTINPTTIKEIASSWESHPAFGTLIHK